MASRIHPDRAADRPGHPDRPFESGHSGHCGPAGDDRQLRRGAGNDPNAGLIICFCNLNALRPCAEHDNKTLEPAVGHQHV